MKVLSMTATFGKLENQTLTLQPGLNILQAPNEWGKSTWCAFLAVMLYGLDTREKTTKSALAVKERYAPWSGAPMSGRIDLTWQGRNITIERWTKGRTPMGEFRAYETESGLPVGELTAAGCGQTLLGVERSVFLRAGYLRLTDLPVTDDESLRRRLNALVTTGDESSAGDLLAQKLKELKNRCRYNRSGLLPQAEAQRDTLESKLRELRDLRSQSQRLRERQTVLEARMAQLENHRAALKYAQAAADARRVDEAENACRQAQQRCEILDGACAALPSLQEAQQKLRQLQELQQGLSSLQMEAEILPQMPQPPDIPAPFRDMAPDAAIDRACADMAAYNACMGDIRRPMPLLWLTGLAVLLTGLCLLAFRLWIPGGILTVTGIAAAIAGLVLTSRITRANRRLRGRADELLARYDPLSPAQWVMEAERSAVKAEAYKQAMTQFHARQKSLENRKNQLRDALDTITGGDTLSQALLHWNHVQDTWEEADSARREYQRAESHAAALREMAKSAEPPAQPDRLAFSETDTARLLSDAALEQKQLQLALGQCQGRMEALGQESLLNSQLTAINGRIGRLTQTYAALELAQKTLDAATAALQRRFAPRIAQQAQEIFTSLTGGRYDRLTLSEDLSVNAGAREESTLRTAQWRSDGTADQLYLALRLAVARELTPDAPLILDDALVRFDDARHAAAMEILREEAKHKQVIVFTCQTREQAAIG